jgi:hypothetical protein
LLPFFLDRWFGFRGMREVEIAAEASGSLNFGVFFCQRSFYFDEFMFPLVHVDSGEGDALCLEW